jgi:hypothetical protein
MYVGSRARSLTPTILAVQARKLIIGGGQAFLAFVVRDYLGERSGPDTGDL